MSFLTIIFWIAIGLLGVFFVVKGIEKWKLDNKRGFSVALIILGAIMVIAALPFSHGGSSSQSQSSSQSSSSQKSYITGITLTDYAKSDSDLKSSTEQMLIIADPKPVSDSILNDGSDLNMSLKEFSKEHGNGIVVSAEGDGQDSTIIEDYPASEHMGSEKAQFVFENNQLSGATLVPIDSSVDDAVVDDSQAQIFQGN